MLKLLRQNVRLVQFCVNNSCSRNTGISKSFTASIKKSRNIHTISIMSTPDPKSSRLVWVDCEMTGLNLDKDTIMEIAVIVTEGDTLEEVCRTDSLVIKTDKQLLDSMDAWCTDHHGKSGLTQKCLDSKLSMSDVESEVLTLIEKFTEKGKCQLAGNSVGQDKRFLDKYMPRLSSHLHYRIVDVSTIKELAKRWNPDVARLLPPKRETHRALEDIEDSIAELKYYKQAFFKLPSQ